MTDVLMDAVREDMRERLQMAFVSFEGTRRKLFALIEEVEAGETARAGKLAQTMSELAKCATVVLTQYDKFEAMQERQNGEGPTADLDLAAARLEIGRRLARLRDAGA